MRASPDGDRSTNTPVLALQLAAGMAIFGSATPISKLVADAMPVFIGAIARCALGALVLLPFVSGHWHQLRMMDRRQWLLVAVIALFGMFGFTVFLLLGLRIVTGVYGSVVMATTPGVTAVAAVVFLHERATWRRVTAVALAVAGVAILVLAGSGDGGGTGADGAASEASGSATGSEGSAAGAGAAANDPLTRWLTELPTSTILGVALVFGAVCCEAVYSLVGRTMSRAIDPVLVAFLAAALSLPLFLPFAVIQWPSFEAAAVGFSGWASLVWYGAGTLALGTALWYGAIAQTKGSIAAAFMGVMPVSALVLSYVLLGEAFQWVHLAGFAVVFCGVLLMSWEHARMSE